MLQAVVGVGRAYPEPVSCVAAGRATSTGVTRRVEEVRRHHTASRGMWDADQTVCVDLLRTQEIVSNCFCVSS